MPNVQRWRHNNDEVVTPAIQSGVLIEIGDLVYQSWNGQVYPASSQPDQGSEAANKLLFACHFLGVAQQQSRVGDTDAIRVKTEGVFEMICPAVRTGGLMLGQRMSADENAGGTALLDQQVDVTDLDTQAIGRLAQVALVGATTVLLKIESVVMGGGVAEAGTCESSSSEAV